MSFRPLSSLAGAAQGAHDARALAAPSPAPSPRSSPPEGHAWDALQASLDARSADVRRAFEQVDSLQQLECVIESSRAWYGDAEADVGCLGYTLDTFVDLLARQSWNADEVRRAALAVQRARAWTAGSERQEAAATRLALDEMDRKRQVVRARSDRRLQQELQAILDS